MTIFKGVLSHVSKFERYEIFLICLSIASYSENGFDHLLTHSLLLKIALTALVYCVRNVYFHPLSKFPGPKKAAFSPAWAMRSWLSGFFVHSIKALHDEYGPVVRIAPNQLSFCSPTSWKAIYGHIPGRKVFMKSSMYEPLPGEERNIVSVANTSHHAVMRRNLSHGFSAAALLAQEDRVQHFVDLLVHQIETHCCKHADDMTKWYNYTTFDIVGELAFGEAFGSLKSGTKPHNCFCLVSLL